MVFVASGVQVESQNGVQVELGGQLEGQNGVQVELGGHFGRPNGVQEALGGQFEGPSGVQEAPKLHFKVFKSGAPVGLDCTREVLIYRYNG